MTRTRTALLMIVVFTVFVLAGCAKIDLYQNLAEEDANEILVLLSENGIKAKKKRQMTQNEVSYSIAVPEHDMVRARSLLVGHNLPRKKELGLTGVYKEKGLIPTPDEQKARFLLAMKGEIINSLERIPQIVDADVVLNVPIKDEFASAETKREQRPTASIVVKTKLTESGESPLSEAKIQQFVANAVEGLNPRDVAVIITYLPVEGGEPRPGDVRTFPSRGAAGTPAAGSAPPPVFSDEIIGLRLDLESKGRLKVYLLVFFLLLIILSSALILIIVQGSRMRRSMSAMRGPAGRHPAIEGHIMDEGPPEMGEGDKGDEL